MDSCVESWTASRDGTRLFYRRWPVERPRAVIGIIHGYADHSGRYSHVAALLNAMGLDVFAIDLRGHGRSDGERGYVSRFERYHEDVDALLERVAAESDASKLFVLGHSMGGLIAMHYGLHHETDWQGAVISSPFLGVHGKIPIFKRLIGRGMSAVHPRFSLPSGLKAAHVSHDPQIVRDYADDPLVFDVATARWFTEAERAIGQVEGGAAAFEMPCLFVQAGDDRIADATRVKPLFDAIGSADKTYVAYPGFYHEVLNETDREKVLKDVEAWLVSRL